jgi:general secretion pathway protein L
MMGREQVTGHVTNWLWLVGTSVNDAVEFCSAPRAVRIVEQSDGSMTVRVAELPEVALNSVQQLTEEPLPAAMMRLMKGGRFEFVLHASHFVFRPLELPSRATAFLDGIVRAQIDRLTPWSPDDAAFGWVISEALSGEQMRLTVAATKRELLAAYVDAASSLGAGSVAVFAAAEEGSGDVPPIKISDQKLSGGLDVASMVRILGIALVVVGLAAALSVGSDLVLADKLNKQQGDIARKIAQQRAAILSMNSGPPSDLLEVRKQQVPATVIALEALSQILPDHTFVTELRIEGDKMQILGITRDAPSLIRIIEQSPHFTRATFFAPTTRSSGDPGERFHIEAKIQSAVAAQQ